jgi:hypothetical protein
MVRVAKAAVAALVWSVAVSLSSSAVTASSSSLYSEDHWTYSTLLTGDTLNDFVQSGIESDQTVFVRFVASPM